MNQQRNKKHTQKKVVGWQQENEKKRGLSFSVIFFVENHLEIWQDVQQNGTRSSISCSLKEVPNFL